MDIANKIRDLRKEKDWSQAELAERVGVSQRYVSIWERGKKIPSAETLIKLSQTFRVSIDYLLLDNVPREGTHKIDDFGLYQLFREAEALPVKEKEAIEQLISGLVFRYKVKKAEEEAARKKIVETSSPKSSKAETPTLRKVAGKR